MGMLQLVQAAQCMIQGAVTARISNSERRQHLSRVATGIISGSDVTAFSPHLYWPVVQ